MIETSMPRKKRFTIFDIPFYQMSRSGDMDVATLYNGGFLETEPKEGDIILCPGYPGEQKMDFLARGFQNLRYTVHLPINPGIGQFYGDQLSRPETDFRFSRTLRQLSEFLGSGNFDKLIVGGYSTGSIHAARLALEHDVDAAFLVGGVFNGKRFFDDGVYAYKDNRGWEAMRQYIIDCHGPRGRVPIKGDPEEVFEDFKRLVETGPNVEEVFSDLNIPLVIVHSPNDRVIPFNYAKQFFPSNARVVTMDMTHEMYICRKKRGSIIGPTSREFDVAIEIHNLL